MDRCGAGEVYMIGPTNNRSSIGRIALEVNDGFPTQRPYDLCSKRMALSTSDAAATLRGPLLLPAQAAHVPFAAILL